MRSCAGAASALFWAASSTTAFEPFRKIMCEAETGPKMSAQSEELSTLSSLPTFSRRQQGAKIPFQMGVAQHRLTK